MDFLTKKRVQNQGEIQKFYIEDDHEAIIEPWIWECVQLEIERRKLYLEEHGTKSYSNNTEKNPFASKVVCGECNMVFTHSDYILHFIERNTSNNLHVMRPFIEAMIEAKKDGYDLNTDDAGNLAKYLNLLGGMYVLDFMSEEWIKEKIKNKITMIVEESVTEIKDDEVACSSEEEKIVTRNSKVVIENVKTHMKIMIVAKKNKLTTKPVNLIGLGIGDNIRIGKESFTIKDTR